MKFLIVGAGFSGLVAAHRLSNAGHDCVVVDKRPHLAGNAHDSYDKAGVLIHNYGPHYFRTNSERILEYLSTFTGWNPVDYTIQSFTEGKFWPFPINLNTFEELIGKPATSADFEQYLAENRLDIPDPKNSEEVILSQVGARLYELFFEGYTLKQWKRHPRELDPSVCGRIPIRTNRDDRYLSETFQALPDKGYTHLLENILAASPNTTLHLNTDFIEARKKFPHDHLIYTGAIDEYFGRKYGSLPYRSLRFEQESFTAAELVPREKISGKPGFWQPYYPIPTPDAAAAYQKYAALAAAETNTTFIGRLATYRYYNMDQVTGMALTASEKLIKRFA